MSVSKISETGVIGADGRLRLPMERVNAFCAANPGTRVVVRFEAAVPGSSELQLAYYYNYIVPTIREVLFRYGTRRSEAAVDRWLVEQYPGDKFENLVGTGEEVTLARNLDRRQMSDFLEWLKQFAAENLETYIEDPRTLAAKVTK